MIKRVHTATFRLGAAIMLISIGASAASAAQVLNEGAAYQVFGFPHFLDPAITNDTTRAWNLGGTGTSPAATDQILNGVTLDGPAGGFSNGLTVSGSPSAFGGTALNWGANVLQPAVRDNISNTGLFTLSPASWSVDISANAGTRYIVEVLSNPVGANNNRSLDITVDGSLYADNLAVPWGGSYSTVYRFEVVADADGIDLTFGPGADNDGNPYVTALSVTEAKFDRWLLSVDIAPNLSAANATQLGATGVYHADLFAAGANGAGDQVGVWENGGAANWWNSIGFSAGAGQLVDADGYATPVTVTTSNVAGSAANWDSNAPSPDDLVTDGIYQYETGGALATTIGGLQAGQWYELIVYHADDYVSELVTANGLSAVDYTGDTANPGYTDAFDGLAGSDFWYFVLQADDLGQIVILTAGTGGVGGEGAANTITGFQLQTIPAPAALPAGLALLGAAAMRRRRRN